METKKSNRRSRVGRVIANSAQKTIKVRVEGMIKHPKYKKYIRRYRNFLVHDPQEQCKVGDLVKIEECRPISKLKKWIVREIIEHGDATRLQLEKEESNDLPGNNA